jgi:hypothetical protein
LPPAVPVLLVDEVPFSELPLETLEGEDVVLLLVSALWDEVVEPLAFLFLSLCMSPIASA